MKERKTKSRRKRKSSRRKRRRRRARRKRATVAKILDLATGRFRPGPEPPRGAVRFVFKPLAPQRAQLRTFADATFLRGSGPA